MTRTSPARISRRAPSKSIGSKPCTSALSSRIGGGRGAPGGQSTSSSLAMAHSNSTCIVPRTCANAAPEKSCVRIAASRASVIANRLADRRVAAVAGC